MADLDNLTNDQLRVKLVENGLGNVPVTNTTRKVLLNKLRKSIGGEVDSTKNSRRETIHVVKPSEGEKNDVERKKKQEPAVNNRRATMAAQPLPSSTTTIQPTVDVSKNLARRSGRITPSISIDQPIQPIIKTLPITINEEDSDDDVIMVPVAPPTKRSSKSRSPSLSKSEMVTTSFKQMVSNQKYKEIAEEVESSDDAEIQNYTAPKPSATIQQRNRSPVQSTYRRDEFAPSTNRRVTLNYADSYNRPAISTSYNYYEPNKSEQATFKRRQTTGVLSKSSEESDTNNYEELSDEQNTPYLSDFARRLSSLKAEPLSTGSVRHDMIRTTGRQYNTQKPNNTILRSFDQKYRKILLLIIALVAAIFIYIMFFTNN